MEIAQLPQSVQDAFHAFKEKYDGYEAEVKKMPSQATWEEQYEKTKKDVDGWRTDATIQVAKILDNYPRKEDIQNDFNGKLRTYAYYRDIREDLGKIQRVFASAMSEKIQDPNVSFELNKQFGMVKTLETHVRDRLAKIKLPLERLGYISSGDYFNGFFTSFRTSITAHGENSYVNCARRELEQKLKEDEEKKQAIARESELARQNEPPALIATSSEGFFDKLFAIFRSSPTPPKEEIAPVAAPVVAAKPPQEEEKKVMVVLAPKPGKKPPSPPQTQNVAPQRKKKK